MKPKQHKPQQVVWDAFPGQLMNTVFEIGEEKGTIKELCNRFGICDYKLAVKRVRYGWPVYDAVLAPPGEDHNTFGFEIENK